METLTDQEKSRNSNQPELQVNLMKNMDELSDKQAEDVKNDTNLFSPVKFYEKHETNENRKSIGSSSNY